MPQLHKYLIHSLGMRMASDFVFFCTYIHEKIGLRNLLPPLCHCSTRLYFWFPILTNFTRKEYYTLFFWTNEANVVLSLKPKSAEPFGLDIFVRNAGGRNFLFIRTVPTKVHPFEISVCASSRSGK